MNLQIYCKECEFRPSDQEEAARHTAMNRGHATLAVRQGDISPEEHTHHCPQCDKDWGCDDPSCEQPETWACDNCYKARRESAKNN